MPGPAMVVRTTRAIAAGEPLALSYLAAGRTAVPRAEILANWGIVPRPATHQNMELKAEGKCVEDMSNSRTVE